MARLPTFLIINADMFRSDMQRSFDAQGSKLRGLAGRSVYVRRPLFGVQIKEERYANIFVRTKEGTIPIFNSSWPAPPGVPTDPDIIKARAASASLASTQQTLAAAFGTLGSGLSPRTPDLSDETAILQERIQNFSYGSDRKDGYGMDNSNFLLQSVQESRAERMQILQTFGEHFMLFYGEQPQVLNVNGILLNSYDFEWTAEWLANYDKYLRGTKCVENEARVYLAFDDVIAEGYLISTSVSHDSMNPWMTPFSFQMILTNYYNWGFREPPFNAQARRTNIQAVNPAQDETLRDIKDAIRRFDLWWLDTFDNVNSWLDFLPKIASLADMGLNAIWGDSSALQELVNTLLDQGAIPRYSDRTEEYLMMGAGLVEKDLDALSKDLGANLFSASFMGNIMDYFRVFGLATLRMVSIGNAIYSLAHSSRSLFGEIPIDGPLADLLKTPSMNNLGALLSDMFIAEPWPETDGRSEYEEINGEAGSAGFSLNQWGFVEQYGYRELNWLQRKLWFSPYFGDQRVISDQRSFFYATGLIGVPEVFPPTLTLHPISDTNYDVEELSGNTTKIGVNVLQDQGSTDVTFGLDITIDRPPNSPSQPSGDVSAKYIVQQVVGQDATAAPLLDYSERVPSQASGENQLTIDRSRNVVLSGPGNPVGMSLCTLKGAKKGMYRILATITRKVQVSSTEYELDPTSGQPVVVDGIPQTVSNPSFITTSSSWSFVVNVADVHKNPPAFDIPPVTAVPNIFAVTPEEIYLDSSLALAAQAFDPTGDPIFYRWELLTHPDSVDDSIFSGVLPSDVSGVGATETSVISVKFPRAGTYRFKITIGDYDFTSSDVPDDLRTETPSYEFEIEVPARVIGKPVAKILDVNPVPYGKDAMVHGEFSYDGLAGELDITYAWSWKDDGSGAGIPDFTPPVISDPTSPTPQITVYDPYHYMIQLVVTRDLDGQESDPTTQLINCVNAPPIARAGAVEPVLPYVSGVVFTLKAADPIYTYIEQEGKIIQIIGSWLSSEDPETGVENLTYSWDVISAPAESTWSASTNIGDQYEVLFIPDMAGAYAIELTVTDEKGLTSKKRIVVFAGERPTAVIAELQPHINYISGALIAIDGSGSYHADGVSPIMYSWRLKGATALDGVTEEKDILNTAFLVDPIRQVRLGISSTSPQAILVPSLIPAAYTIELTVSTLPDARLEQRAGAGGTTITDMIMLPAVDSFPTIAEITIYQKPKAVIEADNVFGERTTGLLDAIVSSPVSLFGNRSLDGTPAPDFDYEWKVISGPSDGTFSPFKVPDPAVGDGPTPIFIPTQVGTYKIILKVRPQVAPEYQVFLGWGDPDLIELNVRAAATVTMSSYPEQAECKQVFVAKVRVLTGDSPFVYTWATVNRPAGTAPIIRQESSVPTECTIYCTEPGEYDFSCVVQCSGVPAPPVIFLVEVLPVAIISGLAGDHFYRSGGPSDVHTNSFSAVGSYTGTYFKTCVWSIETNPGGAASIVGGETSDVASIAIDASALPVDGTYEFEFKVIVTANGKSGEATFIHRIVIETP